MAQAGPQPRYRQLAQTLLSEIEGGRYPVGALMPTEFELCEEFGASRFTVREAVKQLVQMGLVSRRAGIGTRVLAAGAAPAYRQVMSSMADLQQYTAETELEILDAAMAEIGPEIGRQVGAPATQRWLRIEALRRGPDPATPPISFTEILLHPAFRSVRDLGGRSGVPVFVRLEEQFGERLVEVEQQIRAVALPHRLATLLDAEPDSPALWVSRAYKNGRGEIIEVALSTHPADRFSYGQSFQRDWRVPEGSHGR